MSQTNSHESALTPTTPNKLKGWQRVGMFLAAAGASALALAGCSSNQTPEGTETTTSQGGGSDGDNPFANGKATPEQVAQWFQDEKYTASVNGDSVVYSCKSTGTGGTLTLSDDGTTFSANILKDKSVANITEDFVKCGVVQ